MPFVGNIIILAKNTSQQHVLNLFLKLQDLGTPNEKIWPGLNELPAIKKCSFGTFADHPYNTLRQKFGSYLSDAGFDLLNR